MNNPIEKMNMSEPSNEPLTNCNASKYAPAHALVYTASKLDHYI